MVVDSSAVAAIFRREGGWLRLEEMILGAEHPIMSAAVLVETSFPALRQGSPFGDCLSYGLARHLAEPLLFVGDDFARTDVTPALIG